MKLPTLTVLQFTVLSCLRASEMSARELRAALKEVGVKRSGPGFYQLMTRLEDMDFVKGSHGEKIVQGRGLRERRYKITGNGRQACAETSDYFQGIKDKFTPVPKGTPVAT